jgi:NAD(P)-dependent dehydrogenase (short-subunit alcohol dehydrogenase family)
MNLIVVGAGGDIGKAVVQTLAGPHRVIACGRDQIDVQSIVSVKDGMAAAVDALDGTVHGVVTCHGAPGRIKPTLELSDEEFETVIQIDLVGTMRVCREAARYMIPGGFGSIVCLSSIHAIATYPERAAYAAAKAGVVGLVKALAIEWAKDGLAVNAVLPGQVDGTRRTGRILSPDVLARSPSQSLPTTFNVAAAVQFLLESDGVNGHSLVVDDGWLSSAWFKPYA